MAIMKPIKYVVMDCEMIMCRQGFVITGEQDKTVVGLQIVILLVILHGGPGIPVEVVMEDAEVLV